MKIFSLDIATVSGWAFFEDNKLIEFGSIHLISSMNICQKIHYFKNQLNSLLSRLKPDYCFIEDVIMAISGPQIAIFLARLNGVAISVCHDFVSDNVKLFTPTTWKKNSFSGLIGSAEKWEIMFACFQYFNSDKTVDIAAFQKKLESLNLAETELKNRLLQFKTEIVNIQRTISSKRNPVSDLDKIELDKRLNQLESDVSLLKTEIKKNDKTRSKEMTKNALSLISLSGMTDNVCDACGIAICGIKSLNQVIEIDEQIHDSDALSKE